MSQRRPLRQPGRPATPSCMLGAFGPRSDTQDSCWPRGATRSPTGSCQREAAPERPIRSVPAKTPPASCGWRIARRLAVDAPARVSEDPRQGLGLQGRRPLGAHAGCSDVRAPRGARASGLVLARGTRGAHPLPWRLGERRVPSPTFPPPPRLLLLPGHGPRTLLPPLGWGRFTRPGARASARCGVRWVVRVTDGGEPPPPRGGARVGQAAPTALARPALRPAHAR